jgi:hypothetical protein
MKNMKTLAITQAITKYQDLADHFQLTRIDDPEFFWEWQKNLPELSDRQKNELERLKRRYLNYIEDGEISEGTVNIIMLAPLLNLLGWCDRPYRIRGEQWVRIALENDEEILEGRIDALTVLERFWLVVVEGKRGGFNVLQAIPQALAYMVASPNPERSLFGMVTNGYDFLFIKLAREPQPQYSLSHNFTLLSDRANNLERVVQVMQNLVIQEAIY